MKGYVNFNFDLFDQIERKLVSLGYTVINPANISRYYMKNVINNKIIYKKDFDYDGMIKEELTQLIENCDAIYLLPGWENSQGSKHELKIALQHDYIVLTKDSI